MADLDLDRFDAVLFDLDGVLTDTASLHAAAWQQMFDEFLSRWSAEHGEPFVPFRIDPDYLDFVDGKPRYEGVAGFLESRRIVLPEGLPSDSVDEDTICGLGNRKNDLVNRMIADEGVTVFEGAITFLAGVRAAGLATAVVSSSKNAETVLVSAGLLDQFDDRVDGEVAAELGLPGKPAPDTFLEAARRLGTPPERAIVIEDALVGVEAGKLGGFGRVIGVDHQDAPQRLLDHGADIVVADLGELA